MERVSALPPGRPATAPPVPPERTAGVLFLVLGVIAAAVLAFGFLHFVALG